MMGAAVAQISMMAAITVDDACHSQTHHTMHYISSAPEGRGADGVDAMA
jgi:hypothetical protein